MQAKTLCEICGALGEEWHHGIYHRMKKCPQLNKKENMILLCKKCHALLGSMGREGKEFVWKVKCLEFGEPHMIEWNNNLSLKIKDNFHANGWSISEDTFPPL